MNLSVKKTALAIVVCSALGIVMPVMAAGNPTGSSATSLTMHVVGTITNSTCNIRPYTTAGADATTLNLGVMTKDTLASEVNFYLKPENGCSAGIIATSTPTVTPGSTTAQITWESNGLTEYGISNMYGTAQNVHLELSPVSESGVAEIDASTSSVVNNGVIKTGSQTVTYNKITDSSEVLPFKYSVKLAKDGAGNVTGGTFDTDITYTVAYI
ncbi:TPA: hypothetical protein ACIPAK_003692 [Salmonella enterica subsp. enterica serovar Aberdeen]